MNSPHGRSTDHRALDSKRDYIHYSRTQHLIEDNVSRSQENINQRHSASDSPSESRLAETHQNGVCQEGRLSRSLQSALVAHYELQSCVMLNRH